MQDQPKETTVVLVAVTCNTGNQMAAESMVTRALKTYPENITDHEFVREDEDGR